MLSCVGLGHDDGGTPTRHDEPPRREEAWFAGDIRPRGKPPRQPVRSTASASNVESEDGTSAVGVASTAATANGDIDGNCSASSKDSRSSGGRKGGSSAAGATATGGGDDYCVTGGKPGGAAATGASSTFISLGRVTCEGGKPLGEARSSSSGSDDSILAASQKSRHHGAPFWTIQQPKQPLGENANGFDPGQPPLGSRFDGGGDLGGAGINTGLGGEFVKLRVSHEASSLSPDNDVTSGGRERPDMEDNVLSATRMAATIAQGSSVPGVAEVSFFVCRDCHGNALGKTGLPRKVIVK